MPTKAVNNLKYLTLLISVLSVFASFGYLSVYQKYKMLSSKATIESQLLQNQLDEMIKKYDSVHYVLEQGNVITVVSTSKVIEPMKYKIDSNRIVEQINVLKTRITKDESNLIELEKKVQNSKDILKKLQSFKKADERIDPNRLNAVNVNARGVKILSNVYKDNKRSKIQEIRVCFTLEASDFVMPGTKKIYIQVVNPDGETISVNNTYVEQNDIKLHYSGFVEAFYNKKDTDVCAYVPLERNKIEKGTYKINIFNNFLKIGATTFQYN
ncbi:hypothetical protein [Flavobacterium sp. U410]